MITDTTPSDSNLDPRKRRAHLLKRAGGWLIGSIVVLILFAGVTVEVLLHSVKFHAYLLTTVEKQASEKLGTQVTLRDFALHLSTLSLDLYGLQVDGAAPYRNPPLLQVEHAEASVRISSIFRRRWYIDSIEISKPVVYIFVDSKGTSNIPKIKSNGKNTASTNLFDLGVRHAVLSQGEVYYNDHKSVLSADLHNIEFSAAFNPLLTKYSGRLSYTNGHLISGDFKPIPHNLYAQFDATPSAFYLTNAKLSSGSSEFVVTAILRNYSNPIVQAHYQASVDGDEVRQILNNTSIPTGVIHASGNLEYAQKQSQSLLSNIKLQGDLESASLNVHSPALKTQIRNIVGHYVLSNGGVVLQDFKANLLGGVLTARGEMDDLVGNSFHSRVTADLQGVSLAELRRTFAPKTISGRVSIVGSLSAHTLVDWGNSLSDMTAQGDLSARGGVVGKNPDGSDAPAIPVESSIHVRYSNNNQQVALEKSYLRTPQTTLTMNGTISNKSSLQVALQANDLSEFETIADLFRTPLPGHPVMALGLKGQANFGGTVSGSIKVPHLQGQFVATHLEVNGTSWKVIRTGVDLSPSQARLINADLEPLPRGRITFNANAELTNWSFQKTNSLQVNLSASQLEIANLERLAGQRYPINGILNANLRVHGTELNPFGNGDISLTNVVAYQEPVKSMQLQFAGTGDEIRGNLKVNTSAGDIESTMSVRPKQKSYTAELHSAGIHLDEIHAFKSRRLDTTGILTVQANGAGTFDNPQLNATLTIPRLVIQNQTVKSIDLRMNVADHVANANLSTSAIGTAIQGQARVELTGDYMATAKLDTQIIPLQPLVAIYASGEAADMSGQTEIHATLQGPLKNKRLLEAHITIPQLKLGYTNNIQLAAVDPIHVDYKDEVVQVQRSAIRGTDTDLQFQGSIPIGGSGPMSLALLGNVDLKIAQLFDPEVRSSGQVKFNINSNGPVNGSEIGGEIDIVNASYASGSLPVGLQRGNGVLKLTRDRINIAKFQGVVGGGKISAQGGVSYRPDVKFDLGVEAQGIRMLYPQGVREGIDANLRLTGAPDNAVLGGSVNLTDISFTPAFDLTNFINEFTGGVSAPPTPGFQQNLQLNIGVHSTNDINLVSRTLSVGGTANLQIRGTASQPVILGRVNLDNGDIILNGDRFVLNGGTVEFVNPSETEPVVNVSLNTTIQQYNIFLRFNGPVQQLRTEYSSDPALPSADIINLLAFGNTTEANAANASTPANQAAESLVASQVSSQVTSRISKVAGISQLSISPVLQGGSNQGPPGANITIRQRVTGNLFVTFRSNVASTQNQTIQGQYQVTPRVAVSATRDQNGGFAFDTLFKKSW